MDTTAQKIIEKIEEQISDEKDAQSKFDADSIMFHTYGIRIEAMTDMLDEIRFM